VIADDRPPAVEFTESVVACTTKKRLEKRKRNRVFFIGMFY